MGSVSSAQVEVVIASFKTARYHVREKLSEIESTVGRVRFLYRKSDKQSRHVRSTSVNTKQESNRHLAPRQMAPHLDSGGGGARGVPDCAAKRRAQTPRYSWPCTAGRGVLWAAAAAALVGLVASDSAPLAHGLTCVAFAGRLPRPVASGIVEKATGGPGKIEELRGGAASRCRLGWALPLIPGFLRRRAHNTRTREVQVGDADAAAKSSRMLMSSQVNDDDSSEVDQAAEDADPNQARCPPSAPTPRGVSAGRVPGALGTAVRPRPTSDRPRPRPLRRWRSSV
jgi:hypothetical protein